MPDWPPSPPTDSNHEDVPLFHQVPLSCVPPCRSSALFGLRDRLWNWIVARPSFSGVSFDGTADSPLWQSVRSAPESPRLLQRAERLTKEPLVRMTPPSEPMNAMSGLFEANAIACWSGCIPRAGLAPSSVMSVNETPASVERWIARPLDR